MRLYLWLTLLTACGCLADKYIDQRIRELVDLLRNEEVETKECDAKADVVFILDASSSISHDDYEKIKVFVKNMIRSFQASLETIRIAIISFNQYVSIDLYLDQSKSVSVAVRAVNNIQTTDTGTNTHKALAAARTMVFVPAVGDRPDVPNVAIVVTDGHSRLEEETRQEARKLRESGVTVISIGIGRWISDQELQVIATKPASRFSYHLDNFDGLGDILSGLQENTCDSAKETPDELPECDPPLFDIVFILDASSSISEKNFELTKEFVDTFTSSFEISPTAARVAVVTFNFKAQIVFNLNDYDSYSPMKKAIHALKQGNIGTFTNKALDLTRTDVFTVKRESGIKAKKFAVVITDGRSRLPDETEHAAHLLKMSGVTVFSIGIGQFKIAELEAVASAPPSIYNYHVQDYNELNKQFVSMVKTTCKDVKDNTDSTDTPDIGISGPSKGCDGVADILFVVQIPEDDNDYKIIRRYLIETITRLTIGENSTRVAITVFASNPFSPVTFDDVATKEDILNALRDFQLPSKRGANQLKAFAFVDSMNEMGWRKSVPKILVSVLIGIPLENRKTELVSVFKTVNRKGIRSIAVNVGKPWEEGMLALASQPTDKNAIFTPRFDALMNTVDPLVAQVCSFVDME